MRGFLLWVARGARAIGDWCEGAALWPETIDALERAEVDAACEECARRRELARAEGKVGFLACSACFARRVPDVPAPRTIASEPAHDVACPVRGCGAGVGEPCTDGGERRSCSHSERVDRWVGKLTTDAVSSEIGAASRGARFDVPLCIVCHGGPPTGSTLACEKCLDEGAVSP